MNARRTFSVDIVIPVFNEEKVLTKNIRLLEDYCKKNLKKYKWKIILADNGSTDRTPEIGKTLQKKLKVNYTRISKKGRGGALYSQWSKSTADILSYMDVDLSSNLKYFPKLVEAIIEGSDIAIGSRLVKGSKVEGRPLIREIMSRSYNMLILALFRIKFHDAQCGFKAISGDSTKELLPLIKNRNWFFDTELLIVGEKSGKKIKEIPIYWHDDPRSTVKIAKTVFEDLIGLLRLAVTKPWLKIIK